MFKLSLPKVAPLVLAFALSSAPAIPGCSGVDITATPEFARAREVAAGIAEIRKDGVTDAEQLELASLLAEFNEIAPKLEAKIAEGQRSFKDTVEHAKDGAAPLIPPPFDVLLNPAGLLALYVYMRRQNGSALAALKAEVLGPAAPK